MFVLKNRGEHRRKNTETVSVAGPKPVKAPKPKPKAAGRLNQKELIREMCEIAGRLDPKAYFDLCEQDISDADFVRALRELVSR